GDLFERPREDPREGPGGRRNHLRGSLRFSRRTSISLPRSERQRACRLEQRLKGEGNGSHPLPPSPLLPALVGSRGPGPPIFGQLLAPRLPCLDLRATRERVGI